MRLDRPAFQNIRINRTLRQKFDSVLFARLFLKDTDKLCAYDLTLRFRIGYACQLAEKTIHGINVNEIRVHLTAKYLHDLLRLALAQQTVSDMHAYKIPADRLDQQRCDDRRIHSARKSQ